MYKRGQVVKVKWEDFKPDYWLIVRIIKNAKYADMICIDANSDWLGQLRAINFDQIVCTSQIIIKDLKPTKVKRSGSRGVCNSCGSLISIACSICPNCKTPTG
jgi:hypothetical protein